MDEHYEPPTQFTIEAMTVDDFEAVEAIRQQSWKDTYVNLEAGVTEAWVNKRLDISNTAEKIAEKKKRIENSDGVDTMFYVARDSSGDAIGMTTPFRDKDGVQHVGALYVDKRYYGSGVSHQLMQKLIEWANPAQPIVLTVASYNERAKAFYKKWGFKEVEGSEHLHADIMPVVDMIREGV